jgi:hypothetical protein
MIALLLFARAALASPFRSKSRLEAENAALRHQLIVLRRKMQGRVRLTNNDRWFFIQLYRWFPSILQVLTIIRPETLVRWHRAGFRLYEAPRVKGFFVINIFSSFLTVSRGSRERKSALMAWAVPLLGRAERSTPGARRSRRKARGVDGESACQATMMPGHYAANVTAFCVAVDPLSPLKFRLRLFN